MPPLSHIAMRELVREEFPDLSPQESLALRAVAWHETNYGAGWRGAGVDSNNMGAITAAPPEAGVCAPGSFAHEDSRWDDAQQRVVRYTTCFRAYQTPNAAVRDLAETMLRDNVRSAAPYGLRRVAAAMRSNNYYLGTARTRTEQIDQYASALEGAAKRIRLETSEPNPYVRARLVRGALVGALAAIAFLTWRTVRES